MIINVEIWSILLVNWCDSCDIRSTKIIIESLPPSSVLVLFHESFENVVQVLVEMYITSKSITTYDVIKK